MHQMKHAAIKQPRLPLETGGDIHRAIALLQAGRQSECLACLRALNARDETSHLIGNLAGLVSLSLGQYSIALEWFDRALALYPGYPDALASRGMALHQLGRAAEALAAYDEAVRAGCAKPELYYNRGNILRDFARLSEAIASYDTALRLNPAYPEALRAGGLVLRDLGRFADALEFFDAAIRLRPEFADALNDRGNVLQNLDRLAEAVSSYSTALDHAPGRADILNNRGSAWLAIGRCQDAGADFSTALRIAPGFAEAWSNNGNLLLKLQQPEAALAAYEKALDLRSSYPEALCGRAVALKYLRRFDEALECFDAALAYDPAAPHIKNNKGALLLLLGDFAQGFELYEYRWSGAGTAKDLAKLPVPIWNGEDLSERRIAVIDEQGHGDAIQFVRYLALMASWGADITYLCRSRLHRLFNGLEMPVRLADRFEGESPFDFQIALSSLPRVFGTRLETIPAQTPYLRAEDSLVHDWTERLGTQGFKIGICWRGNSNPKADPSRSIPLACFAKLAAIDDVRLISLQNREACIEEEHLPGLILPGEDFDSGPDAFVDTAAMMQNLDLIVTCDTSIAHLAGALGRPVWVILKDVPDWRWLLDRQDSPWYPTMRLFRQKERGDWDEVFDRVVQTVQAFQRNCVRGRRTKTALV
jgi:tetratricopeptide (TPR) repeat protein